MPFLARGRNQKASDYVFLPQFLTEDALARLRESAKRRRGTPQLDFASEVEPLIRLDVEHTYYTSYTSAVRERFGKEAAVRFSHAYRHCVGAGAARRNFWPGMD